MIMKVSRFAFGGKNDVDKWRAHLSGAGVPRRNHCQMCSPDEHILGVQGLPPYFSTRPPLRARPPAAPRLHLFASQRDDSAFGRRSQLSRRHSNFADIFLPECDDGTAFDARFQFISFRAERALGITTDLNAD
jgi:hypothetical protein